MRSRRAAPALLALLAIVAVARTTRAQDSPASSPVQDALTAYLRDPAANAKAFLDAARAENGPLTTVQTFLLADAALRVGRYHMATDLFETVQASGDPSFNGPAEIGLAWAALGRGRLTDAAQHLDTAATSNPALRSFTDILVALVAAANGAPDGRAALAAAAARPDIDPAFREAAPLLDAYARYWAGDVAGAADAFTAFAVSHPDSRFADDALYAAAQAKMRSGRAAEAQADLEALAGDRRGHGPLSSRLLALDGRALLRAGMRRDRALGTRHLPQRIADLLDGDGSRMAAAAIAAQAREGTGAAGDAGATPAGAPRVTPPGGVEPSDEDQVHGAGHATTGSRRTTGTAAASGSPVSADVPARFPWTALVAIAAALLALGLWMYGRGRAASMRSR